MILPGKKNARPQLITFCGLLIVIIILGFSFIPKVDIANFHLFYSEYSHGICLLNKW
jgi:hypothetical protein